MALKNELKKQGDFLFKYRSYLPIIIIVIGLIVFIQKESAASGMGGDKYTFELMCLLVAVFGLLIRFFAIGYSGDNTSGRNTTEGQIADSVNTTGPYSLCRHPLYVGNFFMWLGIAMMTQNLWFIVAFIFLYWLYYERIMYAEEDFLIEKYGTEYTNWSEVTPAFVPSFSNWKKPIHQFSWKKVIRQEKAGILQYGIRLLYF